MTGHCLLNSLVFDSHHFFLVLVQMIHSNFLHLSPDSYRAHRAGTAGVVRETNLARTGSVAVSLSPFGYGTEPVGG